eukprot:SAG22_NODE_1136_length_5395_cov_2.101189_1_plen_270_part_00
MLLLQADTTTSCTVCPAGTSAVTADGATTCEPCPTGTYSAPASAECTVCTDDLGLGFGDLDSDPSTRCSPCPIGTTISADRLACVGCDDVAGSGAILDLCGQCGGENACVTGGDKVVPDDDFEFMCYSAGVLPIQSPYSINWDRNDRIQDGGGDMYDNGNHILTTSSQEQNCRVAPYTDNMEPTNSRCFGRENGNYMMDIGSSTQLLISDNFLGEDMTFHISGDLGADGGGTYTTGEFMNEELDLRAFYSSTCDAGDPSVNHLFIFQNR